MTQKASTTFLIFINRLSKINFLIVLTLCLSLMGLPSELKAESSASLGRHAFATYGEPKYGPGFTHFDYVNPDALKGGTFKLADVAVFDTLNPYIVKGVKAPGIFSTIDSLMVGSLDEPQTMYGLIAESVVIPEDKSYAEFFLRKEARFHDGTPITPEDVVFTFDILKSKGDPFYKLTYTEVSKAEKTGPHSVKFTFSNPKNRELPLIVAALPVLSKAYYATHDFEKSTLEPPLGNGPYKVKTVDQGRSITYERVKDYWARNLPVNRGQNNFDIIHYDAYRDETVALEALKAGEYDFRQEYIARNWATAYDTPAVKDGRITKVEVPHKIPQGMQGFEFNTRLSKFADRRVREAIGLALDYEWANKTLFYGAYMRNKSFFEQTDFAARALPDKDELALLEPFRTQLPPELFTQVYEPPVTDGSGQDRSNLLKADALLKEAGWIIRDNKRVNAKTGEVLTLEFMIRQATLERALAAMRKNLKKLGIDATIRLVDDAQYQRRLDDHDFDLVTIWINRSLFFPGNEQLSYWHSSQAEVKGSNNIGGISHPAVDAVLAKLVAAKDKRALEIASRALDRILLFENYVIPHWHSNAFRIAYWNKFGRPDISPLYDIGLNTWWAKASDSKSAKK
jgi:microcin C transport system substrate-binding protein